MKYAKMAFSRALLQHVGGMPINLLAKMFEALPKDSKMLGFGETPDAFASYFFIGSDKFIDTPDGGIPPDITAFFIRTPTGEAVFEKIDYGKAMGLECLHVWKTYDGIMSKFEYCDKCGVKQ